MTPSSGGNQPVIFTTYNPTLGFNLSSGLYLMHSWVGIDLQRLGLGMYGRIELPRLASHGIQTLQQGPRLSLVHRCPLPCPQVIRPHRCLCLCSRPGATPFRWIQQRPGLICQGGAHTWLLSGHGVSTKRPCQHELCHWTLSFLCLPSREGMLQLCKRGDVCSLIRCQWQGHFWGQMQEVPKMPI